MKCDKDRGEEAAGTVQPTVSVCGWLTAGWLAGWRIAGRGLID